MHDPISFSINNQDTVIHASYYLTKYEKLFNWSSSEDILEVGCANGYITKNILYPFVKNHLHHLIGTDISHSAIEYAKKDNNIPNLSFQTLDITDVDECDNYIEKFHRIFAFYVFHNTHKPELWSRNLYKMLKPKGQVFGCAIVSHPNFYNIVTSEQRDDWLKPWSKYMDNVRDAFYDYGSKPMERNREIFTEAGFVINTIDIEPKRFTFKDITHLKTILFSGNRFLNYIPEEYHDDYKDDFMAKALKYITYHNDGSYEFTFDALIFLVTKN